LIGDSCYDYYHYGEVNRISPEAPIPIFDYKYTQKKNGMAANVLENLLALNADVYMHTRYAENKNRYIDIKSKQQLLSDYEINIRFLSSGCLINVGRKSIGFSSSEEAIAELNRYFENPSEVDDEWQNKFNK
jgi:D-beta-D-heptose 7-phosphate kinase/D-beta-D-heptose 1-phosphate adenosyltransferase